ncbi:MAG: hypothetical protein Q4B65_02455 [Candidatus Saccharibacteria bacterium]|nr:hypothetical protein [Candidatus Saccharibacteria bacterium]
MAKRVSKVAKAVPEVKKKSGRKEANKPEGKTRKRTGFFTRFKEKFLKSSDKRVKLHKSFKRSYREDYKREIEVPGMMYHIFATFRVIFKNWKLFLPLLILSVVAAVVLVGLMSEDSYQQFQTVLDETTAATEVGDIGPVAKAGLLLISTVTTGGLSGESTEAAATFVVLIFLVIWLVTIYLLRHRLAGHKVKFRDGLYNGAAPLLSTLAVFFVAMVQCIPIFILIIVYSAAVQTEFLAQPFYALVFFIFAALMILLSGYLLSSTLMALVAVSAPGLYPTPALRTSSDLMAGRRVKFILRIISLAIALAVMWVVVMLPLIVFDLWIKQFEWASAIPFVPVCLLTMTCFTGIYLSAYFYLYYRWMLNYEEK